LFLLPLGVSMTTLIISGGFRPDGTFFQSDIYPLSRIRPTRL